MSEAGRRSRESLKILIQLETTDEKVEAEWLGGKKVSKTISGMPQWHLTRTKK
jgi:hypothetical protein